MEAWIFVHDPLERYLDDYKATFDAWEAGGVRGIAVGYLRFTGDNGQTLPTFQSDPSIYQSFGVEPPEECERDLEKERRFGEMLDDAADRGWKVLTFYPGGGGGSRPIEEDPHGAIGYAARVADTMAGLPQVDGFIMDGPGEQHYELAFHHGGELLEIRPGSDQLFSTLGFDIDRLNRGIDHLRTRLHKLTPANVRYASPGGTLAGMQLFDINEDVLYWLRARREVALGQMKSISKTVHALDFPVQMGGIPRTATFSSLTCQDYVEMGHHFDLVFPKHYYWHRGFDGLYGTVSRWVQTLLQWNPSLTESDGFSVVRSLFGIELPEINSLLDMEMGFPDSFFTEVVYGETKRALEALGPEKTVCWVSTGRAPHAGDAMPAHDLFRILESSRQAGLQRFLFHPDRELGAPEWHVISNMCGTPWKEDVNAPYWPPDSPRETFSGHREPKRR
ncbi:MAG: hypothetical protein VX294_09995 [Candidatus Latescibacterota bacterium]|nr:hypothetical protein [Candidatus Latescibacterota bacterium]